MCVCVCVRVCVCVCVCFCFWLPVCVMFHIVLYLMKWFDRKSWQNYLPLKYMKSSWKGGCLVFCLFFLFTANEHYQLKKIWINCAYFGRKTQCFWKNKSKKHIKKEEIELMSMFFIMYIIKSRIKHYL